MKLKVILLIMLTFGLCVAVANAAEPRRAHPPAQVQPEGPHHVRPPMRILPPRAQMPRSPYVTPHDYNRLPPNYGRFDYYRIPRVVPRAPHWNPWPEHRQNPHNRGGYGRIPLFQYHYGPGGWGFRIGPNIVN